MSDTLAAQKAGLPAPTEDHCGVPNDVWTNGETQKVNVNGPAPDYFYEYEPLAYDGQGSPIGYFGYKSIGVSYGGTLKLFGKKGASYPDVPVSDSGTSWRRLDGTVGPNAPGRTQSFVVDRKVDWKKGDWVVVTTTDYLPSHSEEMQIAADSPDGRTFTTTKPFAYRHQGTKYPLPADGSLDRLLLKANQTSVETRAAVALLTRSIVIVSAGDTLDPANPELAPNSTSAATRSSARASRRSRCRVWSSGGSGRAAASATTRCTSTWRARFRTARRCRAARSSRTRRSTSR